MLWVARSSAPAWEPARRCPWSADAGLAADIVRGRVTPRGDGRVGHTDRPYSFSQDMDAARLAERRPHRPHGPAGRCQTRGLEVTPQVRTRRRRAWGVCETRWSWDVRGNRAREATAENALRMHVVRNGGCAVRHRRDMVTIRPRNSRVNLVFERGPNPDIPAIAQVPAPRRAQASSMPAGPAFGRSKRSEEH